MKIQKSEWGDGIVKKLSDFLQHESMGFIGFSDKNLWRMKQFHELYGNYEKLSTVLRELSWSSHLHIMSKTHTIEEREFYLRIAIQEQYSVRELERAIDSSLFEKSVAKKSKVS
jgi:predicted nuclease of restriction endonuclease-like (RecB) superfamily